MTLDKLASAVFVVAAVAGWTGARAIPASSGQSSGSAGVEALAAGRYDEAVRLLRGAALDGDAAALGGWIAALSETGAYDEAVESARSALDRGVPGARARLGSALLAAGRIEEARAVLLAGAQDPGAPGTLARVELGIWEYRYGDRSAARRLFEGFVGDYNDAAAAGERLSAEELVATGRALARLSRWHYEYAHDGLRALDEARSAAGPAHAHAARIAAGELFLERYDAAQAAEEFRAVLARNPSHPDAHYGLARVALLEGSGDPATSLDAALATNPNHLGARTLLARIRLLRGDRAGALREIEQALSAHSAGLAALGTLAAVRRLAGDSAAFSAAMERVERLSPTPTTPFLVLSELSTDHRKYEDALRFARAAAAADSTSWTGWGLAGIALVRLGRVDEGRKLLERAFAGDPFNPWFKNTLDLLDTFAEYHTVDTEHFRLVLHESEAELLAPYAEAVAERAYRDMAERYGAAPGPIRVEVYPRHADFSVRTVGLVGIGALGVSFGPALAMDSPAARPRGAFNWASTLWHEIAHSFHMSATANNVPRWFSEGLAVHEQRKGDSTWGRSPSVGFVRALASGQLRPVSRLDQGFSNPRRPNEVAESYYQASLVFEFIEERHGFEAVQKMLAAYRRGDDDHAGFAGVLGVSLQDFDRDFDAFLRQRFSTATASVGKEPPGPPPRDLAEARRAVARNPDRFELRMALGRALFDAGRPSDAVGHFEAALRLFPSYGGPDGAHWYLGRIREEEGRLAAAAEHYGELLRLNESHYEARIALSRLQEAAGERADAAETLRGVVYVHPYEVADHRRLSELLESLGDWEGAALERRAVLALDPVDRAAANYHLANTLHRGGDRAGARRAVLAALEIAPNYEDALDLLLEIRGEGRR